MPEKLTKTYKLPLLVSIALAIVLTSLKVERYFPNIVMIILGALLGIFVLDLDYVIHTYFIDPASDFSKMLQGYVKHKDINGFLSYIKHHGHDLKEKTLNSALFQIVLIGIAVFTLSSSSGIFLKTLVVSTYINSMYRFAESHLSGHTKEWFWALKVDNTRRNISTYTFVIILALVYLLSIF